MSAAQGVTADWDAGERWLRPAAEQGHAIAQFNLGPVDIGGSLRAPDYVLAYA